MRIHAVLSVLTLVAVALSGCSDDEPTLKEWEDEEEQTDALDTGSGNETADGDGADDNTTVVANAAPTASLVASASNGTAPLNVTFTLDGDDADGDNLTWTFTVGNVTEDGADLPATVDATLEAGNWTATLTVSDGQNETVASVVVEVGAGAGEGTPSYRLEASVSWMVGNAGCGASYDVWEFGTPAASITHGEVALAEEAAGLPYHVEASKAAAPVLGFIGFDFYNADGALVEPGSFAFASTLSADGVIPAGAAYVLFNDCLTQGEGTATIVVG